jgi:outer membrane receptor protein involved in Fe transport
MRLRSALFAILVAIPAAAQTPAPSPSPVPSHVEYMEITATRVPENPDEVPASITVLTRDELRDWGATDLTRALSFAAGVDVAPGGDNGPASSVLELWGLKEFDAFLLVVDGVPWGGAFNPALASLDLGDIERIEVLRGAAPVMYGATSFVGVIHVVHQGAGVSKGSASLTGGSFESGGGRVNARVPSWLGFESGISVDFTRQGFADERTAYRRGQALWRNSRQAGTGRFRFDVAGTWLDQDPASPHPREGKQLSDRVPLDANHNPEGAFLNERRIAVNTGYDRPLGNAEWSTSASFSHASQKILRGFLAEVSNSDPNARGIRETIELTDIYFDTHLAWTSGHTKLVAGLDHLHGEGEAKGGDFDYFVALDGSNPPAEALLPPPSQVSIGDRREFSGLYSFFEWNPEPRWRFEVGGRLNRTNETREGEEGPEPAGGEEGRERTDVRLSGSAGLSFKAWERRANTLRLFADYRNTFKPAAIDFGVGEADGADPDRGGILKPETAQSYEAGAKLGLLDRRLLVEASAFLLDFRNLVVARSVDGVPGLENAGTERFKGVEASVAWRIRSGLSWRAAYSLHDARFRDFVMEFDGVPTQLAGKRFELSAHHLGSTGLVYAPPRGVLGLVQLQFVGSRFLNKRNTALADGYTTVTAALGYRSGRWDVRLDGRNLGNTRPPISESELGDAQYYRLPARRFDVTASVRF